MSESEPGIGLSNYEKQRRADEAMLQEALRHVFREDEAEWGWFDPMEWFACVPGIIAFNNRPKDPKESEHVSSSSSRAPDPVRNGAVSEQRELRLAVPKRPGQ